MKMCNKCKEELPLSRFNKSKRDGYQASCRKCQIIRNKEYEKNKPWIKTYKRIFNRCNCDGSAYKNRGIKNTLTFTQLKKLWFRDNANNMLEPSIDRINTKGDYTLDNCRFIELKENLLRPRKVGE